MNKALSVFMFVLLLVSMSTMASKIQPVKAEPKTWTVDDDGPADFTSISEAIATANSGDTVYVYNGTYHENVFIHKSLTLIGENKYGTIVDVDYGTAVRIELTEGVTLTGFTIRNAEIGVSVYWSDHNTIVGNVITNCTWGGPYWGGGISLEYSNGNTVADNIISNTTECGIWLNSNNNIVAGNTISETMQPQPRVSIGVYFQDPSHDNIVFGNTISQIGIGIYAGTLCYNNTIIGNMISDLTIYGCGINIWGPNNTIVGNTITNMEYVGIQLNSISSDGKDGVPNACANNVVRGNTISNSTFGINLILAASSNTIVENNVANNSLGILLSDQSNNNTIIGNLVSNSDSGILLFSSNNTKVCHNSFIDNVQQILLSESFNTAWDDGYPSGGNYWSDYGGADMFRGPFQNETGSDGIGDTSYIVDTVNQDNYPLMAYGTGLRHVGDVNNNGRIDILDIAMVARAFGSCIWQARYNLSCDFNFDGRVDIKDIAMASSNFGWHQ
ncbi:right-handed parallel beta-helix repeat-containing protein [Candidatus Bathyarchaeota archaeon]|nr:right-handed parallel beta-helix repeat-containing protein [Candidatus Bathyarchaeota archaeon]